jgi:DNA repair exonuclease SbcCD nuclease subunit
MKPYALCADLHAHNWSAFSSIDEFGVNSRLAILISELDRCANEVRKAGGNTIVIAGDVFHVRGSIAPSVLNPVFDALRRLKTSGIQIVVLAGNHDLEGKESSRISSALTSLEGAGCWVANTRIGGLDLMERVCFVPWIPNIQDLKNAIIDARDSDPKNGEIDLIIHAPIDGVIPGLPDHGLSPEWLAEAGFRNVFAGHYHNHKRFPGNVWSIGAIAHHSWSDVGSKAGFLIVSDDGVKWFKSHAPEFVEITADLDPDDIPLIVDANYVRAKVSYEESKRVGEIRSYLEKCGAKGVVILAQKEGGAIARAGSTIKAGESIDVSVSEFIKKKEYDDPENLAVLCMSLLNEVRGLK